MFGGVVVAGFAIVAYAARVVTLNGIEGRSSVELDRVVVGILTAVSAFKRPGLRQHVLWCGVINGFRCRRCGRLVSARHTFVKKVSDRAEGQNVKVAFRLRERPELSRWCS